MRAFAPGGFALSGFALSGFEFVGFTLSGFTLGGFNCGGFASGGFACVAHAAQVQRGCTPKCGAVAITSRDTYTQHILPSIYQPASLTGYDPTLTHETLDKCT